MHFFARESNSVVRKTVLVSLEFRVSLHVKQLAHMDHII